MTPAIVVIVLTTVENVEVVALAACGNWLAIIASGGNSHNWNARSAPKNRRHGFRNNATTSSAKVNASRSSQPWLIHANAIESMRVMVKLLQQFT